MKEEIRKWMEIDGERFLREVGVGDGQTVLDFGCGEGHYTVPVSKVVGKNGKVYALDKDKSALDRLEQLIKQTGIKNVTIINEDSRIPLEDNSVDAVLCYDVIHFVDRKERKTIYNEIYRVLKGFFSVYPKHHKRDYPLMKLADIDLEMIVEEIEEVGFILEHRFFKRLLHDEYYNEGYILNFRKS